MYVWIKQIYSVCNSLNANMQLLIQCILIVAKPLLTRVYVNTMLKMLVPSYCLVSGSDKTQLNPAELRVQYHCLCIHIMSTTNEIIATMAAAGHQEVITSLIQTCMSD